MQEIRRNWKQQSVTDRKAAAKHVVDMAAEPGAFQPTRATLTPVKTAYDSLVDIDDSIKSHENALKALRNQRIDTADSLADFLYSDANNVELLSDGDSNKILTCGYELLGTPSNVAILMVQVQNLVLSAGDHEGQIDAVWDPVPSARVYEVQTSANPTLPESWKAFGIAQSRSSLQMTGLIPGQRIWVRVRALGAGDLPPGEYSDPATKVSP